MNRQKRIFLLISLLFLIIVLVVAADIFSRTTFPGSKGNLEQRIGGDDSQESTE